MGLKGKGEVRYLSRTKKALMIEAFILEHLKRNELENATILDIGSGNGNISEYFAQKNTVHSVDIEDKRTEKGQAIFQTVDSEKLPFENATFDIVISHHVIEHVSDQNKHLSELRRVLKSEGIVYLATPNKSSPIMEGHKGNNMVLKWPEMQPLFKNHFNNVTCYSMKAIKEPNKFHMTQKYGQKIPEFILKKIYSLFPSHIFIFDN